jgi:hypothetical protein
MTNAVRDLTFIMSELSTYLDHKSSESLVHSKSLYVNLYRLPGHDGVANQSEALVAVSLVLPTEE